MFLGEQGMDAGGPTREFFRLLKLGMNKYLEPTGCFKHDLIAFQVFSLTIVLLIILKALIIVFTKIRRTYTCNWVF